jgi:alpha-amylase/alpha-mannosidase (GH57 family)
MSRYLCVHGHFYQPPRENPWLEEIEQQESAYPYHDWNERISAECYAPNAAARVLDSENRIVQIVNNYERISFNFGPTLLSWMEHQDRPTYQAILEADAASQGRFRGHGSAIAQVYNHLILPLASPRDQRTQVRWGIADFRRRFRRDPEGMWLAETAADLPSLEVLAAEGIRFTILAPRQCQAIRKRGEVEWEDVSGGRVDPSRPYLVSLPSGRSITVFFYDGPISQGVAFEGLLHRGENFAHRLLQAFSDRRAGPQLAHIATDGETYGHHHRGGEMALAFALSYIEEQRLAELTNYGEFLERFPPTHEAQILEPSSWSCAHGVERWRSDCGCRTGGLPGWTQAWRGPLREALDWLRDELARRFEERGARLLRDPWAVRDDYIEVILDRSPAVVDAFLARHGTRPLQPAERQTALKLLEMQRFCQLMYTSCGWFFDELSGIEPVQILQYASRAAQLCEEVFGEDLEPELLRRLERARSNVAEHRDGRLIYEKQVRPARVTPGKVAAHFAMTSLFDRFHETSRVYAYQVRQRARSRLDAGTAVVVLGEVEVQSLITGEQADFAYGVIHVGDHNPRCGVSEHTGQHDTLAAELARHAAATDLPAIFRALDRAFGSLSYSLQALFKDEQRRLLALLLEPTIAQTERTLRDSYERHRALVRFLAERKLPLPGPFQALAAVALNAALREAFTAGSYGQARALVAEARLLGAPLDVPTLESAARLALRRQAERLHQAPDDLASIECLEALTRTVRALPFPVSLREAQDVLHELGERYLAARRGVEDPTAVAWVRGFEALGDALGVRV